VSITHCDIVVMWLERRVIKVTERWGD